MFIRSDKARYKPRDRFVYNTAKFAMAEMNGHSKKNYSIVDVLKAVSSRTYTVVLTFTAFEDDGADPEDEGDEKMVNMITFTAMVAWDSKPEKMELMEHKSLCFDYSWRELHMLNGRQYS